MHQTRCISTLLQYFGNQVFFADVAFVDVLNSKARSFADF